MAWISVPLGKYSVIFRGQFKIIKNENIVVGLQSGRRYKGSHYLFIDYDKYPLEEIKKEVSLLMQNYSIKRCIIMESSPEKYHVLSFTPIPYSNMIKIIAESSGDKNHKGCAIADGVATIRISKKPNKSDIKYIMPIINSEGENFYNYKAEKAYYKLCGFSDIEIEEFTKGWDI